MALNIVGNFNIINEFKRSQFFIQNLGLAYTTIDKSGRRIKNTDDKFSYYYTTLYKTTIYGQGNIGDIKFYTDHYIKDSTIAIYYGNNFEEFLFKFNPEIVREKGLDFYLGSIIKEIEERYEEKKKNDELKKLEPKKEGNPDMITMNPGAVTYADVKAYLDRKQRDRYKNNPGT